MKLSTSSILQLLTVGVQILDIILPIASEKTKVYITVVTGCITLIIHTIAGQSNPDGTPVETAYKKRESSQVT